MCARPPVAIAMSASPETTAARADRRVILGVPFFVGSLDDAVSRALAGGLTVAPSAPGLAVDLVRSATYREALTTADLAITDSGFMVLLWRWRTGEKLPRHSGLKLMRALLERPELKAPGVVFWVMPSTEERDRNLDWLRAHGFPVTTADCHVAPRYAATGELEDVSLVATLRARKPCVVMLAVGGGVQERLGLMLRRHLAEDRPAILCLGAAIAFLTGAQTAIPNWADRLLLGWLLRWLARPSFGLRLLRAMRLAPLIWRHGERLPPLEPRAR